MTVGVSPNSSFAGSLPTPAQPVQSTPAYAASMQSPQSPQNAPSAPMTEDSTGGSTLMAPTLMLQNTASPGNGTATYNAANATGPGATKKSDLSNIAIGVGVAGALAVAAGTGVWYYRRGEKVPTLRAQLPKAQRNGVWLKTAGTIERSELQHAMLHDPDPAGLNYYFGQDLSHVAQPDIHLNNAIQGYVEQHGVEVPEKVHHSFTALRDGKVIGIVALKRRSDSTDVNLAYWLKKEARGSGLAKSLVATAITYVLKNDVKAQRVYAYVDRKNVASNALATGATIGMKEASPAERDAVRLPWSEPGKSNIDNDKNRLYSISRDEWKATAREVSVAQVASETIYLHVCAV
jgi:RimJ/RimL family protein N-acetyltransferase